MSAEVVMFPGITKLDLPPARVLDSAAEAKLSACLVVGWTEAGEFYFSGSMASGPEALWLLELARTRLLNIGEAE